MTFNKIFKKSSKGAVQQWQIFVDGGSFYTEAGQVDGKITRSLPTYTEAKNEGKANATTAEEQAIVEAQAKWDKKLKEGYVEDMADIDKVKFIKPILAYLIKKRVKPIEYPVLMQKKMNGFRCVITKDGAFTRTGEKYHNVKHIIEELKPVFSLNPDLVLDGELNNPDDQINLNRLVELIAVTREEKDITPELEDASKNVVKYCIYDGYISGQEDVEYVKRFMMLRENVFFGKKYVYPIEMEYAYNVDEVFAFADKVISENYEGAILRIPSMTYEHKRSMNLLKIKKFEDAEFKVVAVLEGKGNWAGCAKKMTCELEEEYHKFGDTTFEANLDGTMENARNILQNKNDYIGKYITVRFQERNEYGTPIIPYTNGIVRDYE